MNVLHVISDQHIASCVGAEGHPQAITPNMDRLAREGVRFRRAYTQNPICTPSRVSVLSGQYCHNHGYYGLSGPTPKALPSYMEHFRSHGYRTGGVGKLHVPNDPTNWLEPACHMLKDSYFTDGGKEVGDTPYYDYLEALGLREREDSVGLPEFPGRQQLEGRPSRLSFEHSVEGWCVKEAIDFMEDRGNRPFCLQVSLPRPHQCHTPDQRFWDMYPEDLDLPETFRRNDAHRPPHFRAAVAGGRSMRWQMSRDDEEGFRRIWRGYLASVTHVDHALGLLLDYLDDCGIADETVVVYHADHGAYSGHFGIPEKAPGICSESVCRVPMLWRVPGLTPTGAVCDQFVENVDLAPTLAAVCGLPQMETTDGHSLSNLLAGGSEPVRQVAVTENPWSRSIRWGKWRFVHYQPEMFDGDVGELYDMEADANETTNLYSDLAHSDVVHACRRLLLEWLIGTSRVATAWPPSGEGRLEYVMSGDGKESNEAGPRLRHERGQVNYL